MQWHIQDLPEEGASTAKVGVITYYFGQFFPKTAWKWKNMDPEGMRIPDIPLTARSHSMELGLGPGQGTGLEKMGFYILCSTVHTAWDRDRERDQDWGQKICQWVLYPFSGPSPSPGPAFPCPSPGSVQCERAIRSTNGISRCGVKETVTIAHVHVTHSCETYYQKSLLFFSVGSYCSTSGCCSTWWKRSPVTHTTRRSRSSEDSRQDSLQSLNTACCSTPCCKRNSFQKPNSTRLGHPEVQLKGKKYYEWFHCLNICEIYFNEMKIFQSQESPPAWTQEAYRPRRIKYYSVGYPPTRSDGGRGPKVGYPLPSWGTPPPGPGWSTPPSPRLDLAGVTP